MHPAAILDTDILSELFKEHELVKQRAAEYIREHSRLTISHITKYEILKGLKAKKGR
jgi:tRNA(fMet)-specific endonuclease VapC